MSALIVFAYVLCAVALAFSCLTVSLTRATSRTLKRLPETRMDRFVRRVAKLR